MSPVQPYQPACHRNEWLDRVESLFHPLYELNVNMNNYSVKCAGQFQAAKIDPSRDDLRGEGRATQNGDESDKERSGKNRARPNGEDEEHIISPASYVTHSTCKAISDNGCHRRDRRDKASGSKHKLSGDHDGTQFFRRIHLIYLNDDIMYVGFHIQTLWLSFNCSQQALQQNTEYVYMARSVYELQTNYR
jgi:hypothetical protein